MHTRKFLLAVSALLLSAAAFAAPKREKFFTYRSFWPETQAMENFGKIGVDTYAVMPSNTFNTLGEPYCKFPPFWVWYDTYLWGIVDEQFDLVLRQNPKAKFICMIDINSPLWLARQINRKYGIGGDSYQDISNSVCMKSWREPTEKMFRAYIRHMEEKYGDKIVSYMVAAGGTDEWYCQSKGRAVLEKENAWHAWLKENNFPDAEVPTQKELRSPAFQDKFFDPATQAHVVRYARFTEEIVAKAMSDFADIAREIVGDKKQIGSFCGYIPMQFCGKLDNRKTYASKNLDFIGSPGGYDSRKIGMGGGTKAPLTSLGLTEKHWFQEIDHGTHTYNSHLTPYVKISGIHENKCKSQKETDAMLKREFSFAAVMHNSLWCFDMWGGLFSTPETLALVGRAHEIWLDHKDDPAKSAAEILLVVDPDSGFYTRYSAYTIVKTALYATGAPFDIAFFSDISKIDMNKYKMVVFPHSHEITPEKEALLKKYVFTGGKTVVSMAEFGITDGTKIDVSNTKRLIGFDFGTKGISQKDMDDWKSVYSEKIWTLNPKNLRSFAEAAKVHFYTDEPVPVYANEKLVAVHVKDGGLKTVSLPKKAKKITELFGKKTVAENTDKFEYQFDSPDTALFEVQY